jgi:hypothetical protein
VDFSALVPAASTMLSARSFRKSSRISAGVEIQHTRSILHKHSFEDIALQGSYAVIQGRLEYSDGGE